MLSPHQQLKVLVLVDLEFLMLFEFHYFGGVNESQKPMVDDKTFCAGCRKKFQAHGWIQFLKAGMIMTDCPHDFFDFSCRFFYGLFVANTQRCQVRMHELHM